MIVPMSNPEPDTTETCQTQVATSAFDEWLDSLVVIYRGHAARAGAEHEAHLLGLMARNERDHSEVLLRGMWHILAEAIIRAPIPAPERGRRLLDIDDNIPARYRQLRIEHRDIPHEIAHGTEQVRAIASELADLAIQLRALQAFNHTRDQLIAVDERARNNWQFALQLLGRGPNDPSDH
ncbi:hypothetical protein AB0N05_15060 [Nocardia sp. NPDC051030]|uniref:hypothetical protein n=1 Tax=Nocardia sp. NPDC051030 TaxID=3155162 RepID=UPI003426BF89